MRMAFVPVLLTVSIFSPNALSAPDCRSLDAARWLLGTWIAIDGDKTFTETWTKLSEVTFEGKGVTTKGPAQAIIDGESLRLLQMEQGVFYVSKVAHNRLPIAFELTQCSPQRLVFENAAHDFPRWLEYVSEADSAMTVHVTDGGNKGFTLSFKRQPETLP